MTLDNMAAEWEWDKAAADPDELPIEDLIAEILGRREWNEVWGAGKDRPGIHIEVVGEEQ